MKRKNITLSQKRERTPKNTKATEGGSGGRADRLAQEFASGGITHVLQSSVASEDPSKLGMGRIK